MSIVPPLGTSRWGSYAGDSFTTNEPIALQVGRLSNTPGRLPVVLFHDYQHSPAGDLGPTYENIITALDLTGYPVLMPNLLGLSQWATDDVVGPSGAVDDLLDWANTNLGTRKDKIAIVAFGMGTLNALNWAWRNPGKVRSLVLIGPIVNAANFYNSNPGLQAAINADWGSGAAWTAGLPTHDPMANLALVSPLGGRMQLWYGSTDTQIASTDVLAFAELIGAEARQYTGNENQRNMVPAGDVAMFTYDRIKHRDRLYLAWEDRDLARIEPTLLNGNANPALRNTNAQATLVAPGGRRFEFRRLTGTDGNERWVMLAAASEFQAVDMAVKTTWFNGDGALSAGVPGIMVGQHGNPMRVHIDHGAGTFLLHIAWVNILFNIPWIIDRGVWAGTLGTTPLTQPHTETSEIPGLRLAAGGDILASSRHGNVVTLVVHEADLDNHFRSGIIDIVMAGAIGNYTSTLTNKVTRVDANHLQYTLAGADVASGGPGTWADFTTCFPYVAETELIGTTMRGRFYKPDQDPPDWGDPNWTFEWHDTGLDGWQGYGQAGTMIAHTGINNPGEYAAQQIGALSLTEM